MYSRFQIYQDGSRYVSGIVALVEEYIFPVAAFGGEVFQVSVLADSVLLAELLPELAANWVKVSVHLEPKWPFPQNLFVEVS